MLSRLFGGLFIGGLVGAFVAALAISLGVGNWSGESHGLIAVNAFVGYFGAVATGMLVGLFAGKPIWASGGKIEAGLKAGFGAVLGAGLLFALRTWAHMSIDVASLLARVPLARFQFAYQGQGAIGDLAASALPLIGAALGAFYGADNTPEPEGKKEAPRVRVGQRHEADVGDEELAEEAAPSAARRRRN